MKTCLQCGGAVVADAVQGMCPGCLMKMGAGTPSGRSVPLPEINDLALLFPPLEIIGLIGRGGMGAVYKARQKELDRVVALKILPPATQHSAEFATRFAREARALAKLNHPNIVALFEFGHMDDLYYFLMEYVDGLNLRQVMEAGRIAPKEALAIVPEICDALQYAHDQGIIHRDIKPENILMSKSGQVKIADFGVAKLMGVTGPDQHPGDAHYMMGTPQYMAPEQRERPQDVDHRADIYSLGVVFYQMLTGELPARAVEPPSKHVLMDVRLDEVVLRAIEHERERRYQQAGDLKTSVATIVATPPAAIEAAAGPVHPDEPGPRHLALAVCGLVIGIACIVFGVWGGKMVQGLPPYLFKSCKVVGALFLIACMLYLSRKRR